MYVWDMHKRLGFILWPLLHRKSFRDRRDLRDLLIQHIILKIVNILMTCPRPKSWSEADPQLGPKSLIPDQCLSHPTIFHDPYTGLPASFCPQMYSHDKQNYSHHSPLQEKVELHDSFKVEGLKKWIIIK